MPKSRCFRGCVVVFVLALLGMLHVAPALAANGSVVYTYDALGRVSTASYDTGVCIIYTYEAAGNRLLHYGEGEGTCSVLRMKVRG